MWGRDDHLDILLVVIMMDHFQLSHLQTRAQMQQLASPIKVDYGLSGW